MDAVPATAVSVTFWGAAHTVTGSMHLVEAGGRRVLLDCGVFRGHHAEARPRRDFPFTPHELDAVVITHAHADHCGNLPRLVRQGFAGPVYCTPATRELLALVLAGSARFQEEDAFVRGVVGGPDETQAAAAFTRHDVEQAIGQCVAVSYDCPRPIAEGVELRLADAGHILGSAMVALTVAAAGREHRVTFTGDLGRRGTLLLREPALVPPADLLISESTYGGRVLDAPRTAAAALEDVVRRTAERGGKVLIPAFSLGRMQVVVYCLEEAIRAGRLPPLPVFVDSPLAADIADVYRRFPDGLDAGARSGAGDEGRIDGETVRYVRSAEESRELSTRRQACVILAPGGMCEGGRILQHLKQNVDDPRCSIVLVNYQAPHTPGRRLLERGPTVRFHGRKWNKWADVVYLAGFSGHADHDDLLAALRPLAGQTRRVRLVHGEPEQAELFAQTLRAAGFPDVAVPALGESVTVA